MYKVQFIVYHICWSLVELAGEFSIADIELDEGMARRERHLGKIWSDDCIDNTGLAYLPVTMKSMLQASYIYTFVTSRARFFYLVLLKNFLNYTNCSRSKICGYSKFCEQLLNTSTRDDPLPTGLHADMMILLSLWLVLMVWMTCASWSTPYPL